MTLDSGSNLNENSAAAAAHVAEQPAYRKFTLADALILIAGLAIVLSMGAHLLNLFAISVLDVCFATTLHLGENWQGMARFWNDVRLPLINTISYASQFAGALLFGMTPTFLILRMRRPRPRWRSLLLQPGMAAALAMVFGLFWVLGVVHIVLPDRLDSFTGPGISVGGTVAAAWLMLAVSGKWKVEPGWVDRFGILLGVLAISLAFLGLAIHRL